MADYYPLIARAVAGLDKNTGDARRALYERARTALVAQLRGVTPSLSESDVTRERLALEEAVRKVEAECARHTWTEPGRQEVAPEPPPRGKVRPPEMPRCEEPLAIPGLESPPAPPPVPASRRNGGLGTRADATARRQPLPRQPNGPAANG